MTQINDQKPGDVAKDLWSQIFERGAAHPGAAIMDTAYDPREDEARAKAGFAAAGWSEKEIATLLESAKRHEAEAPSTSPGVNRSAEAFHAALCNDVEAEMARQGLETQLNVARGIEPVTGPRAAKVGVMMTDESIVTVGAFTFRFCGLIAKAFHRTVLLDAFYWESDRFDPEGARLRLLSDPALTGYWTRVYMSFSMTGTNAAVPFEAAPPAQVYLVEQIARAMEIFVIAHEYGHHHHGHGREMGADPRAEEFAADQFALQIGRPIGERDRTPVWNPYLASGAGGVIILRSLQTLRRFEHAFGAALPQEDTHPEVAERVARFDSVAVMEPETFGVLQGFRTTSERIMLAVDALMREFIEAMPEDGRRNLTEIRARLCEQLA